MIYLTQSCFYLTHRHEGHIVFFLFFILKPKKLCVLCVSYVCAVVTNRQRRCNSRHGLKNKITKKFLDIKNYSRFRTPSERWEVCMTKQEKITMHPHRNSSPLGFFRVTTALNPVQLLLKQLGRRNDKWRDKTTENWHGIIHHFFFTFFKFDQKWANKNWVNWKE